MTEEELLGRIKKTLYNKPPHQARDWILDADAALQEEGISIKWRRRIWIEVRKDALQRLEKHRANGRHFLFRQIAGTIARLLQDLNENEQRTARGAKTPEKYPRNPSLLDRMRKLVGWS